MNLRLYGCYAADFRISMQIYINSLANSLSDTDYHPDIFTPTSYLERYSHNRSIMRYLRYIDYPRKVVGLDADIHHVIDHGYAHLQPKLGMGKTCITVHDLIPLLSWKSEIDIIDECSGKSSVFRKPLLNLYSLKFLQRFDRIITISQSTYNDLVKHLHLDPSKIVVIPPIIESHFGPVDQSLVRQTVQKYELDSSNKWLMISGGGYYKNHTTCLNVLKQLNKTSEIPVKLIRTGHRSKEFDQQVIKMQLTDLVSNIYIEDAHDLPRLYAAVDCLLFPSLYEGFGMPVAEALACGTPVVCSNRGSLSEIAKDLIPHLDAYDVAGLTKAVHHALFDPSVSSQIKKEGFNTIKPYRSNVLVKKLEAVYSDCLSVNDVKNTSV